MITLDTTSSMTNDRQLSLIVQLTELDGLIENADPRSIRWLYDRYGGLEIFENELERDVDNLIQFFLNEPQILADMGNDELEWDG
jgi:hypothetical protein